MKKIVLLLFTLFFTSNNSIYSTNIEKFAFDQKPSLVISTKQINIPGYPKAFNPSIIKVDEGYLLTFRVLGKKINISHIGFVLLDENFEIISNPELLSPRSKSNKIPSQAEDARVFSCNGKLYIIYNDNEKIDTPGINDRRDIFVAQITYENGHFSILQPVMLYHPDYYKKVKVQKNWVPFEWNNLFMTAYSINPHDIIYPDLDSGVCIPLEKTKASIKWKFGNLRGGTPASLFENEYLAFFHSSIVTASEASNHKPMRHYFMGAYTFQSEPPFSITKMTEQPLMHPSFYTKSDLHQRVIFPGGYVISGSNIYLVYGKDDHEVWVATIDIDRLKETLKPISDIQHKSAQFTNSFDSMYPMEALQDIHSQYHE